MFCRFKPTQWDKSLTLHMFYRCDSQQTVLSSYGPLTPLPLSLGYLCFVTSPLFQTS